MTLWILALWCCVVAMLWYFGVVVFWCCGVFNVLVMIRLTGTHFATSSFIRKAGCSTLIWKFCQQQNKIPPFSSPTQTAIFPILSPVCLLPSFGGRELLIRGWTIAPHCWCTFRCVWVCDCVCVCIYVCVCVCVCVCDRERERDRECVCMCVPIFIYVCVFVCLLLLLCACVSEWSHILTKEFSSTFSLVLNAVGRFCCDVKSNLSVKLTIRNRLRWIKMSLKIFRTERAVEFDIVFDDFEKFGDSEYKPKHLIGTSLTTFLGI